MPQTDLNFRLNALCFHVELWQRHSRVAAFGIRFHSRQRGAIAIGDGGRERDVKTLLRVSIAPAVGFLLLAADGQAVTASAAFCRPLSSPTLFAYSAMGFANVATGPASSLPAMCIIPVDTALSSSVSFAMRVHDNSNTHGFSCTPGIYDELGNGVLAGTPPAQTTGNAFVGASTLSWTVTVAGTNVDTNLYSIQCNSVPGNFSVIYSARAQ